MPGGVIPPDPDHPIPDDPWAYIVALHDQLEFALSEGDFVTVRGTIREQEPTVEAIRAEKLEE